MKAGGPWGWGEQDWEVSVQWILFLQLKTGYLKMDEGCACTTMSTACHPMEYKNS